MTIKAVAADSARYDAMDALTNVASFGGGAGSGIETDILYQGTASISRKVTGAGFYTDTGANRDMTATARSTWLAKVWLTNYSSLTSTGNSLELRIGSAAGAYYGYVVGSPTVNYPAKGGFVIVAIDPNIAAHRDSTAGSPALATTGVFGCFATCSTSKENNLAMDAVDVGQGLYITGGTSTDPDGEFSDFVADDEGDITNGRFGYVITNEGVLFVLGRLTIGAISASGALTTTATVFTDTGATLVFPDNKAAAGFSGLVIDLGDATTVVTWTRCSFSSVGTIAGEDTRAVLDVVGTSGSLSSTGSTFSGFAALNLTTAVELLSCNITNSGQIDAGGGAGSAGATLTGSSISASTAISALLWDANADTVGELDNLTFTSAGTGHAIQLGTNTPSSIEFSGHFYSGYAVIDGVTGNEVLYNNSGKEITISVTGAGSVPTVRNGAGASTIVIAAKSLTLTGLKTGSEVRIYRTSDDVELAGVESSTTSFTYNYAYTVDTPIYIRILHLDWQWLTITTLSLISTDQSVPIQQVKDRNFSNP